MAATDNAALIIIGMLYKIVKNRTPCTSHIKTHSFQLLNNLIVKIEIYLCRETPYILVTTYVPVKDVT